MKFTSHINNDFYALTPDELKEKFATDRALGKTNIDFLNTISSDDDLIQKCYTPEERFDELILKHINDVDKMVKDEVRPLSMPLWTDMELDQPDFGNFSESTLSSNDSAYSSAMDLDVEK